MICWLRTPYYIKFLLNYNNNGGCESMGSKSKLVFETLESDPDGIIDASEQILNVQGTQFLPFT